MRVTRQKLSKIANLFDSLTSKYGTSMEDMRKATSELSGFFAQQKQQETAGWTTPRLMTAMEARQYGVELPGDDWMLKISPGKNGDYSLSYLTPKGWEMLEDQSFISPQGESKTYEDMMTELYGYQGQAGVPFPLPVPGTEYYDQQVAELDRIQWERIKGIFGPVFPDEDIEAITEWAYEKPDEFLQDIQMRGRNEDTEALLKALGANQEEVDQIFKGIAPPVDERSTWEKWKDVGQAFISGMAQFFFSSRQDILSTLPSYLLDQMTTPGILIAPGIPKIPYPEDFQRQQEAIMEGATGPMKSLADWQESGIQQLQDIFKQKYEEHQGDYQNWLNANPEYKPPPELEGPVIDKIKENPKILLDPTYIAYIAAETAAFTLAFLGTTAAVTAVTKQPHLGLMAGVTVTSPALIQDVQDDMMRSGASFEEARDWAVPIGNVISLVEIIPGMIALKALMPGMFRGFGREIAKEVSRRSFSQLVKQGLKTFSKIEIAETLEEIIQGVIQDVTVRRIDKNRRVLENIPETVLRTLIATLPLAIIGGGSHTRYLYKNMTPEQIEQVETRQQELEDAGVPEDQAELAAINEFQETPEGRETVERAAEEVAGMPEFQKETTKGWEKVTRQSTQLESGKWQARLVGEKSGVILAEQELESKPAQRDFKKLENSLKKRKEIRYDPYTGKYIKVRQAITHVTKANWDALSKEDRQEVAKSAGLGEEVGLKSWEHLTLAEKITLKTSGVTLPDVKQAKIAWDNLTVKERVTLVKAMGLEGKVGSKSWQALSRKEQAQLRKLVIEKKVKFTKEEAQEAAKKLIAESVAEQANLKKPATVVEKLTQLIEQAEPIRKITEQLKHEELIKRSGRASAILDSAEGKEAFQKSKAALEGALPRAEITPPELQLNEEEVKDLFNIIRDSDLQYFEKLNTSEALTKLLAGEIPTEGELQLLERVFGPELAQAILSKKGRGFGDRLLDVLNLPRAVLASWDLSAPLRQGSTLFWGQPKQAIPAMGPMVKAFVSAKYAQTVDEVINSGQYAQVRRDAGLYIAPLYETTAKLGQREEAFMTTLSRYVPLVPQSERAYITYLNKLRADVFDVYARQWEGMGKTMADYKALASAINILTGRGPLGKLTGMGATLNALFFSPRYQASRIMLPVEFFRTTPTVRKMMARNILAVVTANLAILSLIVLATKDSDEPASVETDSRSTDFGKVKIGNTRLDFWAGFQQYARMVCQVITGMRKVSTTGKLTDTERWDVLERFARSKLSPVAGLVMDILKGESFLGDEFSLEPESVKTQAFNRLVPMFVQDVVEAIEDSGITGALMAFPGLLGVGVQTYGGGYWEEFIDWLGKPKQSDTTPYSVDTEDIYDTKDFYGDISPRVTGIKSEDIDPKYGIPELVQSVIQAKAVKEIYQERPSERLIGINADIAKGDTYENYYIQWQEYQKLTTDEERAEFTKQYPHYYMGNFTHQELALLREYHLLNAIDQKAFLEEHPELAENPRQKWLKSHPQENALLALWGQAKLLTSESYNEVNKLIEQLDIPWRAVEHMMPPIDSKDNYFKYLDISEEHGANSWEARLLLLEDDQLREWLGRAPIDDNIETLRLQIENRALSDEYDGYSDRDSPFYIDDEDARARARDFFKENNPDWVDDMNRVEAYKMDFPENLTENYVEYYSLPEKGYDRERYLLDNPDFYNAMVELKGLVPFDTDYKVPDARYDEIYHEYGDLFEAYENVTGTESERAAKREQILRDNSDFARARREREAYGLFLPEDLVDDYTDWYEVEKEEGMDYSAGWYEDDWFLMEHGDFYNKMVELGIWQPKDFSKVPTRKVYMLYKTYLGLPTGKPRNDFRVKNPDLDAWLVKAKGYTPIGERGSKEAPKTPWQEAEEAKRVEEWIKGL